MKTAVSLFDTHHLRDGCLVDYWRAQCPQLGRCEKAMKESCTDIFDEIDCRAAVSFCQNEVSGTYENSGAYEAGESWFHLADRARTRCLGLQAATSTTFPRCVATP